MIDIIKQLSVVSGQSSAANVSKQITTDSGQRSTVNGQLSADNRTGYPELKEVAKEMESLFAYELIKVMRETTNSMFSEKGFGYNTYTSLFDMEISRLFAERGLGLQDALMRWMERTGNGVNIDGG